MDRVHAMRVFVTVVDRRSLSAAAASLDVSLASVSRVLARLERELGVKLLTRTSHGLAETDEGRLYYRRCVQILADIHEADTAVQSHAVIPTGELRVTAPVTFGRYHVAPCVAEFLERHPRLSFYLSLTDHRESLTDQHLDLAVRVASLRDPDITARRLGYVQRVVVGSKQYFETHPVPRHPRDLARHDCVLFSHYSRADEWTFDEQGQPITVHVSGRLRANNQEALLDAVMRGAGLALLPTWLIREHLESERLRRVLVDFEAPRTPVYAVFPTQGPPPPKVRAFVEYLAERYRAESVLSAERTIRLVG
jgi:DNA-binding transcriptional LysR family regulator